MIPQNITDKTRGIEKSAEFENAIEVAVSVLRVLLTEDSVISFIEGELELKDGELMKAYKALLNAKR